MKLPLTLPLKVSLWLLLNLALLAAAAVFLYAWQFGRGWNSVAAGALGDRLQARADALVAEYHAAGPEHRDAVLAEHGARAGVQYLIFTHDGRQVAGLALGMPGAVRSILDRGPRGDGRRFRPPPRGAGFADGPPPGALPPPDALGHPGPGHPRTVFAEPDALWVVLRIPYLRDGSAPFPGNVVIRVPGLLALLRLLDLLPWLGIGVGAFALSVLFWLPLVRGITGALARLTAATEAIAEGRFDTRVPESRRDELGQLGHSVNRMAARLDTLVNGQRRFLGDVAHELGSPLGRLQVATEILEQRAGPELRPAVDDVREEVQQMALLVNELLAFTRAGLRPREAELVPVELPGLVDEVLSREDPDRRVVRAVPAGLAVRADRDLLARALANLVRNALRYAGPAAMISLGAGPAGDRVRVHVQDTGPGVPPEALARLGEPFYRPESARTRETGGVGLGLAIVRSAAVACGGEARFSAVQPTGFRAELVLLPA